jgi:hypothetical protein
MEQEQIIQQGITVEFNTCFLEANSARMLQIRSYSATASKNNLLDSKFTYMQCHKSMAMRKVFGRLNCPTPLLKTYVARSPCALRFGLIDGL